LRSSFGCVRPERLLGGGDLPIRDPVVDAGPSGGSAKTALELNAAAHGATICSRLEWDYGLALADGAETDIAAARRRAGYGEPVRIPVSGTFDDSMCPLLHTGRLKLVEIEGQEVLPGIRFLLTPGHSIDHSAIELTSGGDVAIFGGDVMHHPLKLYDLDLVSCFCEFPEAARRSRQALLIQPAEREALYCSAHFPLSSAGKINREGAVYRWTFQHDNHSSMISV
jgi:glyoxylase-like metal-dependent hydrolase (beta-lactamase superfamily II)